MPITWKSGTVLFSAIAGSIVGAKKLMNGSNDLIAPPSSGIDNDQSLFEQYSVTQEETNDLTDPETSYFELKQSKIEEDPFSQPSEGSGSSWNFADYTEEQKIKNREEAKRIYRILDDYTFKFFMPCGWGTAWILDYQIPEQGKYPTKWYIATNAHVIQRLSFSENTYGQNLPKWDKWIQYLRTKGRHSSQYNSVKSYQGPVRDTCWAVDTVGHIDINLSHHTTGEKNRSDVGGVALGEMKEPKLFFSAFNFLNKNIHDGYHFLDFVVLEIEFTNGDIAKRVTRDFATKYEQHPEDAIDLFGKPIESKYTSKEELWKAKDNYYILSYPKVPGKDKWQHTLNWDKNSTIASHLMAHGFEMNEQNKNKYKGFVQARKHWEDWQKGFKWQGDVYHKFGHYYQMFGNAVGPGSSGGLFVDGKGVAVAVTAQTSQNPYGTGGMLSWVEPLRSDGVVDEELKINTPKYDLILGAEGQKNSYKQQVEKYILKNGGRTWLSKRGNWTYQPAY
ncbi:hypothetical protein WEN_03070 [Mycoplasma wenyonii str. Massachusetts]|uniref:DUF31 domain-containing protein n=1 Tax=Mycoplasma wenyonii (strain Massachusetts) TaxID=1197325 RepID=I6ZJL8_MYCWM|nr:hypothetical protein [Mycoplasma wenyonii]AFN65395.1 hypothetical protein WEN_03070 [Mycoplasma wenyonii str. Massachusetts]